MKLHTTYLEGAVLPTVVVAALVMLTATLGLLALWEQETLLFTRTQRLRQARADVESAALLYPLHPDERALTAAGGYLLYDSLPQSRIFVRREPWGLYELLHITTADSLVASSRIVPNPIPHGRSSTPTTARPSPSQATRVCTGRSACRRTA